MLVSRFWLLLALSSFIFPHSLNAAPVILKQETDENTPRWQLGMDLSTGQLAEKGLSYRFEGPAYSNNNLKALGVFTGYRMYSGFWLKAGARRFENENYTSCNIYDEEECETFDRKMHQWWADVQYVLYLKTFGRFTTEAGAGIGYFRTISNTSTGATASWDTHYSFHAGVHYQSWLFSLKADYSGAESESGAPSGISLHSLSIGYHF